MLFFKQFWFPFCQNFTKENRFCDRTLKKLAKYWQIWVHLSLKQFHYWLRPEDLKSRLCTFATLLLSKHEGTTATAFSHCIKKYSNTLLITVTVTSKGQNIKIFIFIIFRGKKKSCSQGKVLYLLKHCIIQSIKIWRDKWQCDTHVFIQPTLVYRSSLSPSDSHFRLAELCLEQVFPGSLFSLHFPCIYASLCVYHIQKRQAKLNSILYYGID